MAIQRKSLRLQEKSPSKKKAGTGQDAETDCYNSLVNNHWLLPRRTKDLTVSPYCKHSQFYSYISCIAAFLSSLCCASWIRFGLSRHIFGAS